MFLLFILVTSGAFTGALVGGFTNGFDEILIGATSGMLFGGLTWYVIGTIDRILHERRLDSFFYDQKNSHPTQ